MEEETLSYQLNSGRIADFILCSQQSYVRFSAMNDFLPTSEDRETFKAALKNDQYDRFCCIDEGDDMLVGLKSISDEDAAIQTDVEWWRTNILQYLERIKAPVELGRIASFVERPVTIPRNIRLKDIINADFTKRFCIHGQPDRLMLSKRVSPDEIEESKAAWRNRIHEFLYVQPKDVTLTALGSSVTRPTNLGGSRTKLIELLQSDPEERFHLIYRSPTETIVRVKLSDPQREWLHEKWRLKAAACLLEQKRTMTLTELGASMKRPSVHLGSSSSLRGVLTEDPQSRFILSGQGDNIRVRISTDAELASPSWRRSRSNSSPSGDPLEWSRVTRRNPRSASTTSTSTTAAASNSSSTSGQTGKARLRQTTEAELDEVSARQIRWNTRQPGPGATASPTTTELSAEGTSSAATESPDVTFSSQTSCWEWRTPFDDALPVVRASVLNTSLETSHCQRKGATTFAAGTSAARPSYKDKLLPPPKTPDVTSKAISRPAPGSKGSALSPHAPEYTPDKGFSGTPTGSSGVSGSQRRIEDWLPDVLTGFEPELVRGFAGRLQAEGFLCVRDLVMARALGQLTTEFLAGMGFKIGHCNRIFASLPMT